MGIELKQGMLYTWCYSRNPTMPSTFEFIHWKIEMVHILRENNLPRSRKECIQRY